MRNINNIIDDKRLINEMFNIKKCLQAGLSSLKYKKNIKENEK